MKTKYLRLHSAFSAALFVSAYPAFAQQAQNPADAGHGGIVGSARLVDSAAAPESGSVTAHAELAAARPTVLGVLAIPLTDEVRGQLPADAVPAGAGLIIREVQNHSLAAEAKLAEGDILLTWNEQPLKSPEQVRELVRAAKPGDEVNLTYLRQAQRHATKVVIPKPPAARTEKPERHPVMPGRAAGRGEHLLGELLLGDHGLVMAQPPDAIGVAVERISDELRDQLPHLKPGAGLVVRHIMDPSDAASAGLQKGDILLSWNGDTLVHPEQLRVLVQAAKPGQEVTLGYLRKGTEQQAKLTMTEASKRPAAPLLKPDAGTLKLERLLDDGDLFHLRMPPDERARILEKIRAIQLRIERMRKDVPTHGHGAEGLTKELEILSRELEKTLKEARDMKKIDAGTLLLGPDGKMEEIKGNDLHKKIRAAIRDAGVNEKQIDEIERQMKDAHAAGDAKVSGKVTIVGPDGKVTERVFGSDPAEAKPAMPDEN